MKVKGYEIKPFANLCRADLREANLREANLCRADLCRADLRGANLRGADLYGANLYGADLRGANLRGAELCRADLCRADLRGANLRGADLPHFQIVPEEGGFHAFKKTSLGVIKIFIPTNAKRTSTLIGRKCRASHIKVIDGEGVGGFSPTYPNEKLTFKKGETIYADKYDDDIRVECTNGIHFFMTKKEAEEW